MLGTTQHYYWCGHHIVNIRFYKFSQDILVQFDIFHDTDSMYASVISGIACPSCPWKPFFD
jgi:hypothetical protein